MASRENKCQISQNDILHVKFSEFYLCFHNSCEIWHLFSWAPIRNFLWCYYRQLITSTLLALEKCKKDCNILKNILVQGFCPLKIKIIQFPDGFGLISYFGQLFKYFPPSSIAKYYSHFSWYKHIFLLFILFSLLSTFFSLILVLPFFLLLFASGNFYLH